MLCKHRLLRLSISLHGCARNSGSDTMPTIRPIFKGNEIFVTVDSYNHRRLQISTVDWEFARDATWQALVEAFRETPTSDYGTIIIQINAKPYSQT